MGCRRLRSADVAWAAFCGRSAWATTRRYLIKGDRLQALDVNLDQSRVQVRYRSARHAVIEDRRGADEAIP
ncbi:hypothetical protein JWH11_12865 [Xanthomonas melonis]|uniref:Uncharacterized protein n=1 Tax=Xanthomonas melonis TaxID=56456 RepID=A0ABS8NWI3_9XANT|nr:hypothetical protein [Xanthomonas melonis]MCD0247749.1 hypothetical protein [Xanthomonas melonis]MCD0259893.1 hypothetical protein [Xanthomonas melonis]MCD0267312.1 hypothetical protein [Xanthomonas melonis]